MKISITARMIALASISSVVISAGRAQQASRAPGNTALPRGCAVIVKVIQGARTAPLRIQAIKGATDITGGNYADCFAQELLVQAAKTHASLGQLQEIAKQSSNKQVGSTNGTPGTTSALSQPISLLSLASEYGGLTTSTNAGTYTVQTALDQLPSILAKDHLIGFCTPSNNNPRCVNGHWLDVLHQFSISATFNTSTSSKMVQAMTTGVGQGTTQQVSLTPSGSNAPSLSALTTKYVFFNDKADASGPWTKSVSSATDVLKQAQTLAEKISALQEFSPPNYYYTKWQICVRNALQDADDAKLAGIIVDYYGELHDILILGRPFTCKDNDQDVTNVVERDLGIPKPSTPHPEPGLVASLGDIQNALEDYQLAISNLQRSIETPVLAFEYDLNQPQGQPSNSVFKLILSKNVLDAQGQNNVWTFTGNVAVSIYNSQPASTIPGASLLRDVQVGFEADRVLPAIPLLGQTTLSGAYYFQYQSSPSILNVTPSTPITGITFVGLPSNATQVFTQKGNLNLAQLKWALGTGKNLRFPIAVSYSNRTELISKPEWRAQFGITYDFSSFLAGSSSTGK
jgi:hypothetical protein